MSNNIFKDFIEFYKKRKEERTNIINKLVSILYVDGYYINISQNYPQEIIISISRKDFPELSADSFYDVRMFENPKNLNIILDDLKRKEDHLNKMIETYKLKQRAKEELQKGDK